MPTEEFPRDDRASSTSHRDGVIDIAQYLAVLADEEPIYYCPNPGNAGDSLIAAATFQLFQRLGLQYHLVNRDADIPPGKVVVYGGGGNLVRHYGHARAFLERHHGDAKKLVVLPHTVQGHRDLLKQLGANVDIICRERRSYDYVKNVTSGCRVFLSHDMALHLDAVALLERHFSQPAVMAVRAIVARKVLGKSAPHVPRMVAVPAIIEAQKTLSTLRRRKTLNFFRTDSEKTDHDIPSDNIDASEIFAFGTKSEATIYYGAYLLMKFVDRYEAVRTSRLHGAIAGALLNKRVEFHSNNYFKCKEVYEHSLRDRYPNIEWFGRADLQ